MQIRANPVLEAQPPERNGVQGEPEPHAADEAEPCTGNGPRHASTRGSVGNRPMRRITRYAAAEASNPPNRTTTPADVS